MRKTIGIMVSLLALSGVLLVAQEEFEYVGNVKDFRRLAPQTPQSHDFTFVRLMYNGRIPHYIKNWYTDYPTGDRNLVQILSRVTDIDVSPETRVIPIHHPDLFSYPMIYSSEAGQMVFDDSDAQTMREYLTRGGFWMIDDFWGTFEWSNFEQQMKKIFPERRIVDIPLSHPIFHVF